MSTDNDIVLVGAGQAGAWAARTLRESGHVGRIVLCGAEPHAPYERPPLSKGVLEGAQSAPETQILGAVEMDELDIDFMPDTVVVGIDRSRRQVHCADGHHFTYSRLLLCTGGSAARPRFPGADLPGVRVLRTLNDALALRDALSGKPKLVVIGGGWIGLEAAATARGLGCEVEVLEALPRLCTRSVMPAVSQHLLRMHETAGVRVRCGVQVERIVENVMEAGYVLALGNGEQVQADVVLLAVGMTPNDELAREAGLACDRGIYVDAQCRTSDPSIFAAGDVAVFDHSQIGDRVRLESWQNAQDQGCAAARSMLGQNVDYQPLPRVWSEQYNTMIQIAGYTNAVRRTYKRSTHNGGVMYLGLDENEKLVAAVGVNAGRDIRMAQKWIVQDDAVDLSVCVEVEETS